MRCGIAGLWELHACGVTPRLEELLISGTVSQFEGLANGQQCNVLDVLAASLDVPKCRLSKIVFEVGETSLNRHPPPPPPPFLSQMPRRGNS